MPECSDRAAEHGAQRCVSGTLVLAGALPGALLRLCRCTRCAPVPVPSLRCERAIAFMRRSLEARGMACAALVAGDAGKKDPRFHLLLSSPPRVRVLRAGLPSAYNTAPLGRWHA